MNKEVKEYIYDSIISIVKYLNENLAVKIKMAEDQKEIEKCKALIDIGNANLKAFELAIELERN